MADGIRLNKYLSEAGVCSRRAADTHIENGKVTINGETAVMGQKVMPGDVVTFMGRKVQQKDRTVILAYNKPIGLTCTASKADPDNIFDHIDYPIRLQYVGRLDKDSQGLLLLTNDGDLSNAIQKSVNNHEKEYRVRVNREITEDFIRKMSEGVPILDTVTKKCKVRKIDDSIENVRFHKEEEKNDPAFAKELASLAEIYVNDAFGTAHRAHASTAGVADYLPAVCGYLIQKEITIMGGALADPKRPFVAILGGAKVSDKIGVITNLPDKVDTLIIGGGMAYTFMNALGYSIGTSICESDKVELAKDIMAKAKEKGVNFLIPQDNVVATEYKADAEFKPVDSDNIPDGWMGLDIGEKTANHLDIFLWVARAIREHNAIRIECLNLLCCCACRHDCNCAATLYKLSSDIILSTDIPKNDLEFLVLCLICFKIRAGYGLYGINYLIRLDFVLDNIF